MGPVMRDYLKHFCLAPTQCAANVFRILGCVDALNEKMGLRLTHHDVNWCYNLQFLKGKSYYLKTRDDRVWLIQCLPESSKGLNKEFLIVSGEWHFRRRTGEVMIPILAFIRGGIRIPRGAVMRDYLRHFRLAPTQCAANVFRILGCVDALNEKMGLRLTHHDVNWCYNL